MQRTNTKVTIIFIKIKSLITQTIKTLICIKNRGECYHQNLICVYISSSKNVKILFHHLLSPRNGLINKKNRRHTNENTNQHQKHLAATRRKHPETYSSSQISIDVTELHFDINGRLELTCVSTIPGNINLNVLCKDAKRSASKWMWSVTLHREIQKVKLIFMNLLHNYSFFS